MKDSIVRLVECRASSTNLTVACCKSAIFFTLFFPAIYQIIDQLFYLEGLSFAGRSLVLWVGLFVDDIEPMYVFLL